LKDNEKIDLNVNINTTDPLLLKERNRYWKWRL